MLQFKNFRTQNLTEELSKKEKEQVAKWPKRTEHATKATDHYFGQGVEDKYTPLTDTEDKSEAHKAVEHHLGKQISKDDYKTGVTTDSYGRTTKIGKLLQNTKAPHELVNSFSGDTTRQGKKFSGLTVRTTRSAEGIAGQTSHNQSWEESSCKNFNSGMHNDCLPKEVKHGTVVHYLHDHKGNEIARATSQPYTNKDGKTLYVTDSHYGIKHQGFMDHVEQANKELSTPREKGDELLYAKHPEVYNDNKLSVAIHPDASEKAIGDALKMNHSEIKKAALVHDKVTPHQLSEAQDDKDPEIRKAVAKSPKAEPKTHINKALDDSDSEVAAAAAANPKASRANLHKALDHKHFDVKVAAVNNVKAEKEHIDRGLNDRDFFVRKAALERNATHTTPAQLDTALNDHIAEIRKTALKHRNISPDNVRTAYKDNYLKEDALRHPKAPSDVIKDGLHRSNTLTMRKIAAGHKNIDKEDLENVLNSKSEHESVKVAALQNPNTEPHHIIKALKHKDEDIRSAAAELAPAEHLHHLLGDESSYVRSAALRNPHVDSDHISRGLKDSSPRVQNAAMEAAKNLKK